MMMRAHVPLLRDTAIVAFAGIVIALLANAFSPRGLSLSRDYFGGAVASAPKAAGNGATGRPTRSATVTPAIQPARTPRGLPLAPHADVLRLFNDPRREQQRIIFVDARNDAQYTKGHIPGARHLDHYHLDRTVGAILAAASIADHVVVYCNGGDCEDSELAALDLISLGIPESKLLVYAGGMAEWLKNGLPLESGKEVP